MKKRFLALALAAMTAFSMAACGSSASSETSSDAAADTSTDASASTDTASSDTSTDASASSSGRTLDEIKADGKIIMVTNAEFEPFEYKDGDEIVGIDVDIAKAIADELGVELEISDIAFASCIPALQAGKADFIAAGMSITEERKKNVDFTDNYFNASQAIIVPVDSDIASRTDLNGKTVGVQTGTTGDSYCTNEDGSSDISVGEVKRYEKAVDAAQDVISGRIDAEVIDNFVADKLVEKNPDKIKKLDEALTEEQYAMALPKGSELTAKFNEILKSLQDSGKLDEIESKYLSAE